MLSRAYSVEVFDTIIAGGGLAGILAAAKCAAAGQKCLIIEKENNLGGRIANTFENLHGHGFSLISEELFRYWEFASRCDDFDLHDYRIETQASVGILVGSKLTQFPLEQFISEKSIKTFAGQAGLKDWPQVEKILQSQDDTDRSFAEACSIGRKSGAALALQSFSFAAGVSDLWTSTLSSLKERLDAETKKNVTGRWSEALSDFAKILAARGVKCEKGLRVVSAQVQNGQWIVRFGPIEAQSKSLIVAMPPWNATQWLPKAFWPVDLLNLASKTKPVSAVTLSFGYQAEQEVKLPQTILVPAEDVQVRFIPGHEFVFQHTLDYEESFQAPSVIKAVKALKRAAKKLEAAFPSIKLSGEHVALVPVAWPHATGKIEARTIQKLGKDVKTEHHLTFVGDAYGASYDGDANVIASLQRSESAWQPSS